MDRVEHLILKNLLYNETYTRKVIPYLKGVFFEDKGEKALFEELHSFISTYNNLPTKEAVVINLSERTDLHEDDYNSCVKLVGFLEENKEEISDEEWLLNTTESFCQDKSIYNAIMESVQIISPNSKTKDDKGKIPEILTDALGVTFDPHIGHDYIDDSDDRYNFYHKVEEKIPFDLEYFNKITKGGLPRKTLNIALAGTGVGKSLFMCHVAANCLNESRNVLYITLEMAEEKIAMRIDANLLNISMDDITDLPKAIFDQKVAKLKSKAKGKLIIKEYPTAAAGAQHFRSLLNELALKRDFKPDIIFIDYLNICTSSRIKAGAYVNSYSYIKSIAEELRGLAVEYNVPIVSATQTTRSGFTSTDIGLEDTSESFGLPATADFMFAIISTEELEELGQFLVKQLKNRYSDPIYNKRFMIGVDRKKMRLFDLEESAQTGINDVVDNSKKVKKTDEYDDVPSTENTEKKKDFDKFNFN
jgi:archaellum biogenesis ATPase FlaH|tara:strand:+ start:5513 stop:6937 length:1425 start_codon:yes stop_codon:yes gene_type:complete